MPLDRPQNRREEIFNGVSHAVGLLILLLCMPFLYWSAVQHEHGVYVWTLVPFFAGIIMTYSASTIYHFSPRGRWKNRWRIIDHISIFFLIGGTYTPIIMQYIDHPIHIIFLGIMWTIILLGAIMKFWWTGKYDNFSTGLYVFLGWMVMFVIWPLWNNTPSEVLWWILIGGIFYSIGIYFYKNSNTFYFHVIWHILVFLGTISHLIAIYLTF